MRLVPPLLQRERLKARCQFLRLGWERSSVTLLIEQRGRREGLKANRGNDGRWRGKAGGGRLLLSEASFTRPRLS